MTAIPTMKDYVAKIEGELALANEAVDLANRLLTAKDIELAVAEARDSVSDYYESEQDAHAERKKMMRERDRMREDRDAVESALGYCPSETQWPENVIAEIRELRQAIAGKKGK